MSKVKGSKLKKFLKITGITCLALFLSVTLTGCSNTKNTTGSNELVIWGFVDEDTMKPIIQDFKNENKGIEVKYYKKSLDGNYENNAMNSILSGEGPDVWAMPNDWVYRHKDKLTPLPQDLIKSKDINLSEYFVKPVVNDNIIDKQVYGLSPSVDLLRIYYNPVLYDKAKENFMDSHRDQEDLTTKIGAIFEKFPITWDEFNQIEPYLTVKSGSSIQTSAVAMGTSNNVSNSQDILTLLMIQNQTKMISDDASQAVFNLPIKSASGTDIYSGRNSLDFYAKYADPSSSYYTWNSSMPNDVDAFLQGKVTMIFGYSNLGLNFQQLYPDFNFEVAKIPQIGDINNVVDYAKYTTYTVPSYSKQQTNAWKFITLLSIDSADGYVSTTKELPSHIEDVEPKLRDRGNGAPDIDQLKTATTLTKGRYPVDVDSQLKEAITRVVTKAQSSQASLDTAATNITTLLRKQTW
ncbi:MAG: extracellular solute-binding protein [Patescibacteria group bacterium]|jgi:ABC-type glycerol-3-phosphate transport system substrate-binding protein